MTFKSLLLAATVAGGLVLGASAASAQSIYEFTVTGDPALDGSLDYISTPISSISTSANEFYDVTYGSGAFAGVNEISFSPITSAVELFYDSTPAYYLITTPGPTLPATGSILGTSTTYTISAAPEPGMWALMFAGVAMVGSLLRFSRKQGALAVA